MVGRILQVAGPLVKSGLEEGIKKLPENISAQSLPNQLIKKNQLQEELEFSGMQLPTEGKVARSDLVTAEAGRKDIHSKIELDTNEYAYVTLPAFKHSPNYKENIYTYHPKNWEPPAPKASEMEAIHNMLRIMDEGDDHLAVEYYPRVEAIAARLGHDLAASDDVYETLTAITRQQPTTPVLSADDDLILQAYGDDSDSIDILDDAAEIAYEHLGAWSYEDVPDVIASYLYNKKAKAEAGEYAGFRSDHWSNIPDYLMHTRTDRQPINGIDSHVVLEVQSDLFQNKADVKAPYSNSWMKKALEREVQAAFIDKQAKQMAVPLTGTSLKPLVRGEGVQTWYEKDVRNTLKKLAKKQNLTYEEFVEPGLSMYPSGTALDRVMPLSVKNNPRPEDWLDISRAWSTYSDYTPPKGGDIKKEAAKVMDFWSRLTDDVTLGIEYGRPITKAQRDEYVKMLPKLKTTFDKWQNAEGDEQVTILTTQLSNYIHSFLQKPNALGLTASEVAEAPEALAFLKNSKNSGEFLVESLSRFSLRLAEPMAKHYYELASGSMSLDDLLTKPTPTVYGVLKPKPGQPIKPATLYTAPATIAATAYYALQQGFSDQEVQNKLTEEGYSDTESQQLLLDAKKAQQAVAMGFEEDEVLATLKSKDPQIAEKIEKRPPPTPTKGTLLGDAVIALTGSDDLTVEEVLGHLQVLAPDNTSPVTAIKALFNDPKARQLAKQGAQASEARLLALAEARGMKITSRDGEYFDENGEPVSASFWQALKNMKFELAGAVAGGVAGAKLGFAAAPPLLPGVGPFSKPLAGFGGSILGAAAGSFVGSLDDSLYSALMLQEELNAKIMLSRAATAAEYSAVADVLIGGALYPVAKLWKPLVKAKDFVRKGLKNKAKLALQENLFITDVEAEEAVANLSRVVADQLKGTKQEQQLAALSVGRPGVEGLVRASAATHPKASAAVSKAIDVRAKDLLATTEAAVDESTGRLLQGDLQAYTTMVKENFARVKEQAAMSPMNEVFEFSYNDIAIEPVLEQLNKNILDPTVHEKFLRQAAKIRNLSKTRTFSDLLELRQLVNDFKFNKRIKNTKLLDEVLTGIDNEIEDGADVVFDNPEQWLSDFSKARAQYSEMKKLEKNALAKLLTRPGISQEMVSKGLTRYATAIDDTFVEVVSKLPKASKITAENSVIDVLANKFTAGTEEGMRATHFPMLAKELDSITFTTPQARAMKNAISDLATVFKNDIPLSQATGDIQIPKFQSFLTVDPVVRAKFEIASGIFNWIKSLAPTEQGRTITLVRKTAEVLEDPLYSKSMKELVQELEGKIDVQEPLERLVVEAAKQKAATGFPGAPKLILYGDGKVLNLKGQGAKHKIAAHRIASQEVAAQVAETLGINRADKKALDAALRDRGYAAIQLGSESIRRID